MSRRVDTIERDMIETGQVENGHELEKIFHSAVMELPAMAVALDTENDTPTFKFWNKECEKVLGYTADEIIGNSEALAWLYPDKEIFKRELRNWRDDGNRVGSKEFKVKAKDGSYKNIEWSCPDLQFLNDDLWIFGRDVTEHRRKIDEDRLKQYQFMVESANDVIFFKDLKSRYIIANKKTLEAFGLPQEKVIGRNDYEIMPSYNEAEKNVRDDQAVFETGEPREITKHMTGDDGKEYWFQAIKVPQFDENGTLTGLVGIARDITKHKKMETELRQSQKLSAIGTLAGGIAHEFNNLLFIITGNLNLLQSQKACSECEECHLYHGAISRAANRATNLVRQILTFSRKSDKKTESIDMVRIIKEGMEMMRASIPATIDIVDDVSIESAMVQADSTQMYQIIVNLFSNAKYVLQNTGGIIKVGLDRKFRKRQSYLKLTISDDGPGMSPGIKEHAFEPFFTTKPVGEGSGMGLAVVHGIVEDCGGDIEIASAKGKGTTVRVYLPENSQAKKKTKKASPVNKVLNTKSLRIIVVDDEPELCKLVESILKRKGHNVEVFPDGEKALSAFKNHPEKYNLVITDQTMPLLSGMDLGKKMMEIRPDIPVVLLTGYSDLIDSEKAKKLGFFDYLFKPVIISNFDNIITRIASESKP